MQQHAFAKLNLVLGVTGKRDDGYHLLDTVFCPIDLHDTLSVAPQTDGKLSLTCTEAALEGDGNLVLLAARLFSQRTGIPLPLHFHLEKHIPVQSGLGGGSADAAAALRLLDGLHPGEADDQALFEMALSLGADVPYALLGGTQRARGIGERMTPLQDMPVLHFVILQPPMGLSTPAVFDLYDKMASTAQPDVHGAVCALRCGDLKAFASLSKNALQNAAQSLCPSIETLCAALENQGAAYAAMTGTGSAVFGLYNDQKQAQSAAEALKDCAPFCIYARSL